MMSTKISQIQRVQIDDDVLHSANIESDGIRHAVYFRHQNFAPEATQALMPEAFILAALYNSMLLGNDIFVEESVSGEFLYSLNNDVIPLLSSVFPVLRRIRVDAQIKVKKDQLRTGTPRRLLAMSCGVDSLSSFIFREKSAQEIGGFNALLFNNVGAFGSDEAKRRHEVDVVKKFAYKVGIDFIYIDSNIRKLSSAPFENICGLNNTAAALILCGAVDSVSFASGYPYADLFNASGRPTMATVDAVIFPLLAFRGLQIHHVGHGMTRAEKLDLIMDEPDHSQYLTVCTRASSKKKKINCGLCSKCSGALIYLKLKGRLSEAAESFDLTAFNARLPILYVKFVLRANKRDRSSGGYSFYEAVKSKIPRPYKYVGLTLAFLERCLVWR